MTIANRVQETTTTTGTGTLSLAGAPTGRRTFVAGIGTGNPARYLIENADGTAWEIGVGVVTSGSPDTLTRVTVLASSNANALVNFAAGAKNVSIADDVDLARFGGAAGLPVAGGTADARTIAYKPAKTALLDGEMFWFINGSAANATTTPTLVIDGIGAKTGVDRAGGALVAGDWPANALIGVAYHAGSDRLRLLTPNPAIPAAYAGGKNTIWIPAAAMIARTTNGAAPGTVETTTNKVMLKTLDFDASTIEYAQFAVRMPKSWNEGTISAVFVWSHAATTTNFKVSWGLQAVALSDNEALDTAFGTAQYANDTGGTTNNKYDSPETSAITIANTPATEDYVVFQVLRKADDGTNDTLAIDARLHGITLLFTTDAATDA